MLKLNCKDLDKLKEYIEYKIKRKYDRIKLTQLVLVQSLEDKFDILENVLYILPALYDKDLISEYEPLSTEEQKVH